MPKKYSDWMKVSYQPSEQLFTNQIADMTPVKAWGIYFKHTGVFEDLPYRPEMFLTGGRTFYSFKEAQAVKKKLQKMSDSIIYKVVRVE